VAIVVDAGLHPGATARAAAGALRALGASRIVLASPVGDPEACERLRADADEVVCALTPKPFTSVGVWYRDFPPISEDEVRRLLAEAAPGGTPDRAARVPPP